MNCWEYNKCGREKGGVNVKEKGICPAWPDDGKRCAKIRGTLCNNERQGEYAFKMAECSTCPFYNSEHYERRFGKINQIVDVKKNEPG